MHPESKVSADTATAAVRAKRSNMMDLAGFIFDSTTFSDWDFQ
jgi:hypothetical protein